MKKTNRIVFTIVTLLSLIAIFTCAIVDKVINGSLTWSIIPISSIIFSYLIFMPFICMKNNKILFSLIILSVLTIPYMYVLNIFINDEMFLELSTKASVIGIIYLWVLFILFKMLNDKLLMTAIAFLIAVIPFLLINNMIPNNAFDIWSLISLIMLVFTSISCLVFDYLIRRIKNH